MKPAREPDVQEVPSQAENRSSLASWYTQGLSDGVGDRLLMFDNTNAPAWELLRFRPELAAAPGFEAALRERVEELRSFRHPAFPAARIVEDAGSGIGLALVSTHVEGQRLSEIIGRPRSPAFVIPLLRQLMPALAALNRQGRRIPHGALTADRILVAPDGRIAIREHVLGPSLESLGLSADRLWKDFGVVASTDQASDRRDLVQLALIALSLMLGRQVGPAEYPRQIESVLTEVAQLVELRAPEMLPPLKEWLERVLEVHGPAFASIWEADAALEAAMEAHGRPALPEAGPHADATPAHEESTVVPLIRRGPRGPGGMLAASDSPQAVIEHSAPPAPAASTVPAASIAPAALIAPAAPSVPVLPAPPVAPIEQVVPAVHEPVVPLITREAAQPIEPPPILIKPPVNPPRVFIRPQSAPADRWLPSFGRQPLESEAVEPESATDTETSAPASEPVTGRVTMLRWIAAAAILLVAIQTVVIVRLLDSKAAPPVSPGSNETAVLIDSPQAGSEVLVDGRVAGFTPLRLRVNPGTRSIQVVDRKSIARVEAKHVPVQSRVAAEARAADRNRGPAAAGAPPFGRLQVTSSIAMNVYEGGQLLGSTGNGPITLNAGKHDLRLANESLGYTARQTIDVAAGQTAVLEVTVADPWVNISTLPWSAAWRCGWATLRQGDMFQLHALQSLWDGTTPCLNPQNLVTEAIDR